MKQSKVSVKYSEENSVFGTGGSLIIYYLSLCGREWGGGGHLIDAGHLLTFSAFRMGTYSRWALIRKNTVYVHVARVAKSICTIKK